MRLTLRTTGAYGGTVGLRFKTPEDLYDKLQSFTRIREQVYSYFQLMEHGWFESEGDGTWAALQTSTIKRKKGSTRIERRTDALYESLTGHGAGRVNRILSDRPGATRFIFGTDVPYAGYQHLGFDHMGGTRVPARSLIPPDAHSFIDGVKNELLAYIREK